jgi:hypothetical protein
MLIVPSCTVSGEAEALAAGCVQACAATASAMAKTGAAAAGGDENETGGAPADDEGDDDAGPARFEAPCPLLYQPTCLWWTGDAMCHSSASLLQAMQNQHS